MGCQWMIWIHHPQRCCELLAEDCPPAEGGNEAPGRLPAAESAPAEGADGDSWQSALWKMWHTGLPAVAGNKKLFLVLNTLMQSGFHLQIVFLGTAVCSSGILFNLFKVQYVKFE